MKSLWTNTVILWIYCPIFTVSISIDSLYLDLINRNISDLTSFNKFYKDFLRDVRQHRIIDTVSSPIDVEKIQSKNYDVDYLKNSVGGFMKKDFLISNICYYSAMKQLPIFLLLMDIIKQI
jgi:hypothetical protein